jgi:hypothetical protein
MSALPAWGDALPGAKSLLSVGTIVYITAFEARWAWPH